MKKIKILSVLMALLICASALLVSCDSKEELEAVNLADIMNKSWTAEDTKSGIITGFSEINYTGSYTDSENIFIITKEETTSTIPDESKTLVHIYNTDSNKEILSLTNSSKEERKENSNNQYDTITIDTTVGNYIDIINDKYFAVLSITKALVSFRYGYSESLSNIYSSPNFDCTMYQFNEDEENVDDSFVKYTLSIYDANGTAVRTVDHEQIKALCKNNISNFDSNEYDYGYDSNGKYTQIYFSKIYQTMIEIYLDEPEGGSTYKSLGLIVKGSKAFKTSKDGEPTLIKDFGLEKAPRFSNLTAYGDFYFESYQYTYTVYDKDLNKLFAYSVPMYEDGESKVFFLANGNLLVQIIKQLDQYADKYDCRYGSDNKFKITHLLVTKDATTELDNMNYMINTVKPSLNEIDGQKYYADTVENLAKVYPIDADKTIDLSDANAKIVTLSNNGEILAEVVADQKIIDFPVPVNDDLFSVSVLGGGTLLFNDNGEKHSLLNSLNTNNLIANKYILIENDAIYDLKGEKAFDFKANAAFYTSMGKSSLFITSIDTTGTVKYTSFCNGEFTEISGPIFDTSVNGYYIIENEVTTNNETKKTYSYYNAKGEAIGTFERKLTFVAGNEDFLILTGYVLDTAAGKDVLKTYKFTITK